MKDDTVFCEKCGETMKYHKDGHSICWICGNFGKAVATTYFEPYETDLTNYSILLTIPFKATMHELNLLSKIANCNYVEAKRMIEKTPVEIYCGKAVKVKTIKESLEKANIAFTIDPELPYL